MYRTKVEVIDAITAAELIGTTLLSSDVGCPFPIDPIATYHSKGMHIKQFTKLYKYITFLIFFLCNTRVLIIFSCSKRFTQKTRVTRIRIMYININC